MGFFEDVDFKEDTDFKEENEEYEFSDADLADDAEESLYEEETETDYSAEQKTPYEGDNEVVDENVKENDIANNESEVVSDLPPVDKKNPSSTVVAIGTVVGGDIAAEGGLSVDGTVNGNAYAGAGLTVFRHGKVNGDILAKGRVTISGTVTGDISGDEIILRKTRINGNVTSTGTVRIEKDAVVIGNVSALYVSISGAVCGDIDVNGCVSLETGAIVKGNIRSKSVQIASGAAVDGVCTQCYADVSPSAFFNNLNGQ